jgi:hypothetical protein
VRTKSWQAELAGVVVESTYNWYWLVDGLQDAGLHVYLANTAAIKQYEGLKHSGDEVDARHLAHLLRLGILPTGTILPREHRAVRDLARKRMQLVHCCTTQVLSVDNIMARQPGRRMTSNQIKRLTNDEIDELPLATDVGLAMKSNIPVIATLQSQNGHMTHGFGYPARRPLSEGYHQTQSKAAWPPEPDARTVAVRARLSPEIKGSSSTATSGRGRDRERAWRSLVRSC